MSAWHRGTIYTRTFGDGARLVEIRNDVVAGWVWQFHEGLTSSTWNVADTLAEAKRDVLREAKRRGWTR